MRRTIFVMAGFLFMWTASLASATLFYTTQNGTKNILAFNLTDDGNTVPTVNITWAAGRTGGWGVAEDASKNIWSSGGAATSGFLQMFPAGSNGTVVASQVITGATNTKLNSPDGIFIKGNDIWVANSAANNVLEFLVTDTGDVAPQKTLTTTMTSPRDVAVDASGNVYVVCDGGGANSAIEEFDAPTADMAAPTHRLIGASAALNFPEGIALDSSANMWVNNAGSNALTKYAANTWGNVAPTVTISGASTRLGTGRGIAIDSAGNILAINGAAAPNGHVLTFAAASSGNVAPSLDIGVPAATPTPASLTGLAAPRGIFIEPTPTPAPTNTPAATNTPAPTATATQTPVPTATLTPVPATGRCDSRAPLRFGYLGCSP